MSEYRPVPPQVDLPALEHDVLDFWRTTRTFEQSVAPRRRTVRGGRSTRARRPPTAGPAPTTSRRASSRTSSRGSRPCRATTSTARPAGTATACPSSSRSRRSSASPASGDIEAYGVAEFNARCRESVAAQRRPVRGDDRADGLLGRHRRPLPDDGPGVRRARLVGAQADPRQGPARRGLPGRAVLPALRHRAVRPRAGPGLRDRHRPVGLRPVPADLRPAAPGRPPCSSGRRRPGRWCPTPPSRSSPTSPTSSPPTATETLVVAEPLLETVLGEGWTVPRPVRRARDMERWTYERPFELVEFPDVAEADRAHFVVLADYVTTEDGTGLVHQSPAFGEDDMAVCRAYGLPVVNPVQPGRPLRGRRAAGRRPVLQARRRRPGRRTSQARGLLFRHVPYEHTYPHCWRCHTPLMYYAQPSWYIRTTAVKDALLRENEKTDWYPETIKWGRYGDWLNNNIDWALSRSRYWGTPLPIWRCAEGHQTCVGSLAELSELAGTDQSRPRPAPPVRRRRGRCACPECGERGPARPGGHRRLVRHRLDAVRPVGLPARRRARPSAFEQAYPARLHLRGDRPDPRLVLHADGDRHAGVRPSRRTRTCSASGHILAEDGRKMSKHLGNILEPMPLMDEHGADAVRWFMAASGSPWAARRVGHATHPGDRPQGAADLLEHRRVPGAVRRARPAGRRATRRPRSPTGRCWTGGRSPRRTGWRSRSPRRWRRFDTQRAGALLAAYVDDLSNWYVRRSRRRFWAGDPAALATLHECLYVVTLLMAPITPFITERVWQDLFARHLDAAARVGAPGAPGRGSTAASSTTSCAAQMSLARRLVELGRAARADAKVRTRQPLRRALVGAAGVAPGSREELRARGRRRAQRRRRSSRCRRPARDLVDFTRQGQLPRARQAVRASGPRSWRAAIAAADAGSAGRRAARRTGGAVVQVDGEDVEVLPDEVIVSERRGRAGRWSTSRARPWPSTSSCTPALRPRGLAREVVRLVQEARKTAGFEVSDRIVLRWQADGEHRRGAARARRRWWPTRCWRRRWREGLADRARARARRRAGAGLLGRPGLTTATGTARAWWPGPTPRRGQPSARVAARRPRRAASAAASARARRRRGSPPSPLPSSAASCCSK